MTPIGWRASDVTPAIADRKQNFSQSARRISAESAASTPAATHASRKAVAASPLPPSNAPTTRRAIVPVSATTPGSRIVAAMYAIPPRTRCGGSARARISGAATPFWNGIATPPPASKGASCGATVSTSHSLTQSITTSHGATWPRSSVKLAARMVALPTPLSTTSPRSRSAARCRPARRTSRRVRPARACRRNSRRRRRRRSPVDRSW